MSSRFSATAAVLLASLAMPGLAAAAPGYATGNVNMRAGPSTQYPVITTVRVGSPVEIHGCLSGHSWCDVSWAGARGWVSSSYLQAVQAQRRVFVPQASVPIISFQFGNYWDRHYRGRDFYRDRARWERRDSWRDRDRWERDGRWDRDRDRWHDRDRGDRDRRDRDCARADGRVICR